MKRVIIAFAAVVLSIGGLYAQEKINWTDIQTSQKQIAQPENKGKLIFVDCFTSWCGWCKVMDSKTFADKTITALMNHYFISVKFDAEQKEDVNFADKTYKYVKQGRGGINLLTVELLGNKIGYPSFVILNNDLTKKQVLTGYYPKEEFEKQIIFICEGYDKKMSYEDFSAKYDTEIRPAVMKKIQ
ncbi:MAG: thioredoxin domain-containing protein [Bacteroidales bacterium]|jgi:uncharacterized protein YyaL (SSP411 family)|nr:thioredoxin domain-containing protein [Bacteroidales bacterium]